MDERGVRTCGASPNDAIGSGRDDAAVGVGADGRVRQQAAHEAFGFQVARLGRHRRAQDGLGWELRPIWRGFEDAEESQQWRKLSGAFKGLPTMVLRYIRRLLRGGKAQAAARESMCHHLELDAEHVKMSPLRELVVTWWAGNTAAEEGRGPLARLWAVGRPAAMQRRARPQVAAGRFGEARAP
jgi:hypothetical protein